MKKAIHLFIAVLLTTPVLAQLEPLPEIPLWTKSGTNIYSTMAGNVGIGRSTPAYKLDVNGTINATALYVNGLPFSGGSSQWTTASPNIYFNSGSVGIGTLNPQAKLDVFGGVAFTGGRLFQSGDIPNDNNAQFYNTSATGYGLYSKGGVGTHYAFHFENQLGVSVMYGRGDGNVGIGTTAPDQKLHIGGNLVLNSTSSPAIFTGTGTAELNRYLLLINSTNATSASGLKAGGVLVADSYTYANPGKNDLTVKGNVAIGTTVAGSKLHVADGTGGEQLRLSRGTGIVRFAQDLNQDNLYLYNGNASQMYMAWQANGNVGIGKTAPAYKLDVNGTINATALYVNGLPFSGGTSSQWTTASSNIYFNTGNVGLGTTTPAYKLDVNGTINATGLIVNGLPVTGGINSQWTTSGSNINYAAGIVSIGTTTAPADYKLAVGGKIIATEIVVKLQTNWPDYVFENDYKLPSVEELSAFIAEHKHLPGVPSAKEVKENGVSVGEMNSILLQKIEELTLLMIKQQQEIDELKRTK